MKRTGEGEPTKDEELQVGDEAFDSYTLWDRELLQGDDVLRIW